jgi:hypothetical protein
LQIGVALWNWETETLISDGVFGIATINLVASKLGSITQVFSLGQAITAVVAGVPQPGNSNAIAHPKPFHPFAYLHDRSHNLMTGNQRQLWLRQFPIDYMQIGTAYPTGMDSNQYLSNTWIGNW